MIHRAELRATTRSAGLLALAFAAAALQPATGAAQESDLCTLSYTENQRLRKQGKLKAARQALLACVSPTCPAMVQTDCATWLTELDRQMPTIVVAAVGPDGREVANVAVRDGGVLIAGSLDGRPISLDPGPHELEFLFAGVPAAKQAILVREGEQNRQISVSFAPAWSPPPPPQPAPERDYGFAIAGGVLGGLGVASLAGFIALGVTGQREFDDLDTNCGSQAPGAARFTCSEAQIDAVETKLTAADALLGVGVGLTVLGLSLVIVEVATAPEAAGDRAANRTSDDLRVTVGPGSVRIDLRF